MSGANDRGDGAKQLLPRHRYMLQKVDAAFGIYDENSTEAMFLQSGVIDKVNRFFQADAPGQMFFEHRLGPAPNASPSPTATLQGLETHGSRRLSAIRAKRGSVGARRFSGLGMMPPSAAAVAAQGSGFEDGDGPDVAPDSTVGGARGAEGVTGDGGGVSIEEASGHLYAGFGEGLTTMSPVVYFVKMKHTGGDECKTPINPHKDDDGALTFGVVSHPLRALESIVRTVYRPTLEGQDNRLWGKAPPDLVHEFMVGLDGFVDNLQQTIINLGGGLELRKPDALHEGQDASGGGSFGAKVAARDPEVVSHYVELLEEWCSKIRLYLDDSDRASSEKPNSGPDTELDYWRRRAQRLTSITEQLKTKACKLVIGVLQQVTKQAEDVLIDRQKVFTLVKQWRKIDVDITEAANEAKDNVKYLATLERFLEPLASGDLNQILDILPGLMNAVKMVHTIARYFNTTARMTKLFMKITNQLIESCKDAINGQEAPEKIWDQDPGPLLELLEQTLRLNERYQELYQSTKDRLLAMPKGKQFDFSEAQIFGRFDLFSRRAIKLIDLFSTIQQFKKLQEARIEGMEPLLDGFKTAVMVFRVKGHNLLDYHSNRFDRDFVDFNVTVGELEEQLRVFINKSFENLTSIEQSLALLEKYQTVLHREAMRHDLNSKVMVIFHNYGQELAAVQEAYERHKNCPPAARNMPPVAGNILWSRHLLRRIEGPMERFHAYPGVLQTKDSRKLIKTYNKVARTLVAFEYMWYEAWCKAVEAAKGGLTATLIIQHPKSGRLYVNFDPEILQLIREAKCLIRMGVSIPEGAKMVLLQEDRFKENYNHLKYALREYERVVKSIVPVMRNLLHPHVQSLEARLRPGWMVLTWTSMNIEGYRESVHQGLRRLEELIAKANDIVDNRIEKNLKIISRAVLVDLPMDRAVTLEEFVARQEQSVRIVTDQLVERNREVEMAVEDLISVAEDRGAAGGFSTDAAASSGPGEELRKHYNGLMYRAVLSCTKTSLNILKMRAHANRRGKDACVKKVPFFELDVQLSVPSVRLSPTLEDVQASVNMAAASVLGCAKRLYDWGEADVAEADRFSFFEALGSDLEIIKTVLLLTGASYGTAVQVFEYLSGFRKYDWLWKEDKDVQYKRFVASNPAISDYEAELAKFMDIESEIEAIPTFHNVGPLTLNTTNLKLQLGSESRQWKIQYSNKVHNQARDSMTALMDYIRVTTTRLNVEVDSLDSLRYVMVVLKEVRERESSIEMEITPILDMYQMLEHYLPGGLVDKEEIDQKSVIRLTWRKLLEVCERVTDMLHSVQGTYKKQLIKNVKELKEDVRKFRREWEVSGPMVQGISPLEAVERLRRFKEEMQLRERKAEMYAAGEELFALKITPHPELVKIKKESCLLDQLYGLYMDVLETLERYREVLWTSAGDELAAMSDMIASFDSRCRKMPKKLREWEAFQVLLSKITDFQEILPIIENLRKPSVKPRHWQEVMDIAKTNFPYESENFSLANIMDSSILKFKDDVEEICEAADKQLSIAEKLEDITDQWDQASFEFTPWKSRGVPVLKAYGGTIEELEDAQLQLQTLLSMRYVTPFRDIVQSKLNELSNATDSLELWVKVQLLWTSLESVFMGGDIAKQMPIEAKKFVKIDKDWTKTMIKAEETKKVTACCANEALCTTLPVLFVELEKCQKSLEGYLEQKRSRFPRFYFVSNPVLLLVLSQGSDPVQMQPYYEKVFDSISQVVHDRKDKTSIVSMISIAGADEETIPFSKAVKATGNIEDWLGALEKGMQVSLKSLAELAAVQCTLMPLRQFVDCSCGQFALLGLQFSWTAQCQEALDKCRSNKSIMSETNRGQLGVLQEMSSWCLQDLGTKMNRTKIETLVTIQVHQRDVFMDLTRLYKERKINNSSDFEWLKQARFYWRPGEDDAHGAGSCVISICDVDFKYRFEYLGCKERLVITPLTDRCYITLSQALGMFLGGAPAGPAGTGKTETVKDLGRSLGNFVVVTNCTDQQRYTDMAKIFKGLCQAGLWGCFDEFNRIELPVLSVVAQQVLAITNAKRVGAKQFVFPGDSQVIGLKRDVAYFITMNPGYQGRQELPENLKVLFRSVAMMVPDREIIMKVKLCSVGYQGFSDLARKFNVLYALCEQQLSKQKHYDFGLRNILSVLRTAGKTKRDNLDENEDLLLMKTLRDMNLSKLIAQDVPLFLSLLGDLFPAVVDGASGDAHAEVKSAAIASVEKEGLIPYPSWCLKVIQLYETTLVRHGVMMVGPPGSGKSSTISTLQCTLTKTTGVQHKLIRMNPKAIRAEEMFGETNKASGEWVDGVFAAMWSKFNDRNRKDMQWIVCDGPVDAIWIENLNTVLDDNKILTLANGDRIPMTDNVKLIFEVEDLRNASPATVSRAGIIYVSDSDLDWQPVMESRLKGLPPARGDVLRDFFRKYVGECVGPKETGHLFEFIARTCRPVMKCTRVGQVEAAIRLLSEMLESSEISQSPEDAREELERLFLFSISWALGGLLEPDERVKFDQYLRQLCPNNMPSFDEVVGAASASDVDSVSAGNSSSSTAVGSTVFDFTVNLYTMAWEAWVVPAWEYPKVPAEVNFQSLLVPTVDSTRALAIIHHLQKQRRPVLMVGGSGTAKTTTALMYFDTLKNDSMLVKRINFSSATTAGMFQATIEGELDKRGGKNFGPPSGCGMTVFLDDVSMPEVNEWDDQPTLEIVRQLVETGGFCFLDKDKRGDLKIIEDLQYVGAMNHPGAGKNDIPNRLKRHFFIFNMIVPPEESINAIYGQMVEGRFPAQARRPTFHLFSQRLPAATTALWRWMRAKMLPSPSKFHYTFNMRELSRVFQGLLRAPKDSIPTEVCLMKLWRHECFRVFADKLTTLEDKAAFKNELDHQTALVGRAVLESPEGRLLTHEMLTGESPGEDEESPPAAEIYLQKALTKEAFFVNFLRTDEYDEDGVLVQAAPKVYEEGPDLETLRTIVQGFAEQYNTDFQANRMDLVLFDDALRHLITVSRILGMPRGNMLFVGVGGSGKQSLTRLASYIAGNFTFQITITKAYSLNSFMDDMRVLYKKCGQEGKNATFILTEAEMKDETFLEIMNSFLMTGEVPNLFPKDEMHMMAAEIRPYAIGTRPDFVDTPENLARCFVDRVRANLHCIICMSPISVKFPERARKFPGLVNGCTINWFLSWPAEALVAVSDGFIGNAPIECSAEVRKELVTHMGMVHRMVVESCADYFVQMRRRVYQTPRSFLSFLGSYKDLYLTKKEEVDVKSKRVVVGLDKLKKGASDVEAMKVQLKEEEIELKEADLATTKMLSKLEVSSMAAKKEADAVAVIKEACMADARRIAGEKKDAEEDLAQAKPFLEEAERAVESIKANDLNELKKLQKPSDIIKLIFDCVGLLKMEKVQPVQVDEITIGIGKEKQTLPFLKDSFKHMQAGMLSDARFLQSIFAFSQNEKDFINDETIDLMAPYLELDGFNPAVARNASKAAEGLCTWCRAMTYYHEASKVVKPKLEALRIAEVKLQDAQKELEAAESKLQSCQDVLTKLQSKFEAQMAKKRAIEDNAARTRSRMEQATALIVGLGGERTRWTEDSRKFADTKRRLVGDVALSCAFVGYCGPFNQEFRDHLVKTRFSDDLVTRGIPLTKGLGLTSFLVDMGTIGDWNLDGLPTDPLSIQNGILVTRSSRYPFLIDPQGQALNWIRRHEKDRLPTAGVMSFTNERLKGTLEYCMMEGKALIIAGVEEDIDPMLTPVLEKQIVVKARSKYINVADKMCEFNDSFMLYMTTRLPNPHLSPENQAKTTVVDFTVTQKGLEEQLLGGVIQKEQKSLEEQLKNVLEEVTNNTKALIVLDQLLLERLSANTGNLLDDEELIGALAETKKKAVQVRDKLIAAGEMREGIDEKREQYRPVATRGAVMYFTIVDLSFVNVMYQTSLDQFQTLFTRAMDVADKASLASKRVSNIIETMTFNVYRYISRGLYEQDKLSFKLILALKILLTARRLEQSDVTLFIKGGAALDLNAVRPKPYVWLADPAWLNAIQLSRDNLLFKILPDELVRNEAAWKLWYAENEPEEVPVPCFEGRLAADPSVGAFYRLLLVRSLREDRTLLCVNNFIRLTDTIEHAGARLPAMGPRFVEPLTDTVESVFNEMDCSSPVIYLLSAGADPTDSIEGLARKKKTDVACVSMGEGQSVVASRAIAAATGNGSWVLLQNCHLGLDYMETMEDYVQTLPSCHADFRLFITSEPHPRFPIGLLQMSIKVTNEPPKGLRAGLLRSFTVIVDQDKLERVDSSQWRALLYSLCFMHSIVQERRKFGSLGWCIPYEFNDGDLNACATFLEKHLYSGSVSWPTVQYMVGEVQYGGKITDDLDRRLFKTYTETWMGPPALSSSFCFNPGAPMQAGAQFKYVIPDSQEVEDYIAFIQTFPGIDGPEVFGLHPNADLTFRNKEGQQLLATLMETQPKQASGGTGRSREDMVLEKCTELLLAVPEGFTEASYLEYIAAQGGLGVPLNIFLMQEVQRLQSVIVNVGGMLKTLLQAIRGEVVVTEDLMSAINAVYDARVPRQWVFSYGGDEISWMSASLGLWFSSFTARNEQLSGWLTGGRPPCFWLTGFFNPQGFVTAVQQEVTRAHKADRWSLDGVVLHTEVTEFEKSEQVKAPPKEGVYVHGLYLDGAQWNRTENSLVESKPKELFSSVPVMYVTAVTKAQRKALSGDYGPQGGYDCPVYKYSLRTDKYIIFLVTLAARSKPPHHWTLRGVALLCGSGDTVQ